MQRNDVHGPLGPNSQRRQNAFWPQGEETITELRQRLPSTVGSQAEPSRSAGVYLEEDSRPAAAENCPAAFQDEFLRPFDIHLQEVEASDSLLFSNGV